VATTQDASIGVATESTYKTVVTPTRWYEFTDESLNWDKSIKQGVGLRVGARVARSARRVITSAKGNGDFTIEATSKGMGLLWSYCLGSSTSTLVSGSTYQQVHTLTTSPSLPSFTLQKGVVEVAGTVDAYTYSGCTASQWEFAFPNDDICTLKVTADMGNLTTATSYAAPTYPSSPSLFHFAGGSVTSGTLTAPTTTTLASSTTTLANIRGGSVSGNNNLSQRLNMDGTGRQQKPTVGLAEISGSLEVEYDSTTFRDAVINDTPMALVLNFVTPTALTTGVETLQIVLPEVKFDNQLPETNGADLITQDMNFAVLDNLTAAQPIWVVQRTSDTAL
jgi:hypothetical protein